MDLIDQVAQSIRKDKLVSRGEIVLVGVSGGADSVCLLSILEQLKVRLGIRLHVVHYNHRLRADAIQDERFVRRLANQFNMPITVESRKGPLPASKVSEDKARQWRYDFFKRTAIKFKAESIALAHTQNDLAETILMRLLRGSGLLGLQGILKDQNLSGLRIIRPLLSFDRKDIERYLSQQGLSFCKDKTNQQDIYLRNKIRLKLLPMLIKEYNPNLKGVLIDLAQNSGDDYDYLKRQAKLLFDKLAQLSGSAVSFKIKDFSIQHLSMQRMLLRSSYAYLTADLNALGFVHIQEIEKKLLSSSWSGIVHWPRSVQVQIVRGKLVLSIRKHGKSLI
jgi:tRNA(Ile)-lysidine synthase